MFCINAFTAFESTFLSTYSFLYAGTLPIFLVGPLIDGDAAGWPFIHPSKWNSSSASPFLQSPSTSIQKCSRRGMVHSRNTFFFSDQQHATPCLRILAIHRDGSLSPINHTKSIVLSSFYVEALTMPFISHFINSDENKFFCNAINHAFCLFVRYRRSGNQMKATSIDRIPFLFLFKSLHKINDGWRSWSHK